MDLDEHDIWLKIDAIFDMASVLEGDERANFLMDSCRDDEILRLRVERLLAAHDASGEFLEDRSAWISLPAVSDVATGLAPSGSEGTLVGPYRLLQEIGRGGMGSVFLAERADGQFSRRVAVKVLRSGLVSKQTVQRLRLEREILARLEHPHIARLIDGGITEEGWPYLVMEYVPGVPLTRYCDEHRLDINARLRLFKRVCTAVHYAHQSLVIHRDLTPNNILVTPEGDVKLLDFGIAKLLDDETSAVTTPITEDGLRMMTPEYASPEQIRGDPITTSSDVYQLGVVLYELLSGHRPFQIENRNIHEIARVICDEQPERPSVRVAGELESASRDSTADRLRRGLTGDLDNIVLMALRKDAARRYASAERLGEDIERHLGGYTVRARRETIAYRVSKFVGRHRLGVGAAAVALMSAIGGLSVAIWQARIAADERDLARLEAAKAAQVADFLVGVFEEADPAFSRGDTLTAHEILDRGGRRLDAELRQQPEIRAMMLDVMGRSYQNLGDFETARKYLVEALSVRRATASESDRDLVRSYISLIELNIETGDMEAVDSLLAEAGALASDNQDIPVERADLLTLQAEAKSHFGNFEEADSLLNVALAIQQSLYGAQHTDIATTLNDLGIVAQISQSLDLAREYYGESIAMRRALKQEMHPELAITLTNLGWVQVSERDLEGADSTLSQVLEMRRRLYGEKHPYFARSLMSHAHLRIAQGRGEEARDQLLAAISTFEDAYDRGNMNLMGALNTLANLEDSEGNFEEAMRIRTSILESMPDTASYPYAFVLSNHAMTNLKIGNAELAEAMLREALAGFEGTVGPRAYKTAIVRANLAVAQHRLGQDSAAGLNFEVALDDMRQNWPDGDPNLADVLTDYGNFMRDLNESETADSLLAEAEKVRSSRQPD